MLKNGNDFKDKQNLAPKKSKRFTEHIYIYFDYAGKVSTEIFNDIFTMIFMVFWSSGRNLFETFSVILNWALNRTGGAFSIPIRLFKITVGTILTLLVSLIALCFAFSAGTLVSILGFRNIVEYSLKEQLVAWAVLLLIIFMMPFYLSEYALFKISLAFAYAIGVIGLDFLYGQCGILSLGHASFLLLGGYITTWMANGFFGYEFPIIFCILIAALAMLFMSILLGAPSLKVKDYYLVIMTLAITMAVPKILKSTYLTNFSGIREGGLFLRGMNSLAILNLASPAVITYFLAAISALILFFVAYHIMHHSQIGRAFKIIKCDNEVSLILGIPVFRYKLFAFMLSGFYGGFCGGLLCVITKFVAPDSYSLGTSVNFLVANIVGGPGSLFGASIGGAFLAYEPDLTVKIANIVPGGKDLASGFYGLTLVLAIFFMPRGLAGQIASWLKSKFEPIGRRGIYHFAPSPDYDFLPEDKIITKKD